MNAKKRSTKSLAEPVDKDPRALQGYADGKARIPPQSDHWLYRTWYKAGRSDWDPPGSSRFGFRIEYFGGDPGWVDPEVTRRNVEEFLIKNPRLRAIKAPDAKKKGS